LESASFKDYNRAGSVCPVIFWPNIYTGFLGGSMFDSLSDRIKQDEQQEGSQTRRIIQWVLTALLAFLLFGGLYMGVRMLQ
jgi:hypothetical protein